MTKTSLYFIGAMLLFVVAGCDQKNTVPFPEEQLGISQPLTVPLVFTPEQPLHWDTIKNNGLSPIVKKLKIDDLPEMAYDSTGFRPFLSPPRVTRFDFNALPDTVIDFNELPSKALELTSMLISPAKVHDALPLVPLKTSSMALFDFNRMPFLIRNEAGAVLYDHNGLIWFGNREGLLQYDGVQIKHYPIISGGLPITAIAEDYSGNIWFHQLGTFKLGRLNPRDGTLSYSSKIAGSVSNMTKMMVDDKGNIWLPNKTEKGISIIDPVAQTYKTLNLQNGLGDTASYQMVQDKNKNIWISTFSSGLTILNPSTGKISYLHRDNGLSTDSLASIDIDKNGIVWISSFNGLNAVDPDKGTITYYNHLQEVHEGYSATMQTDPKGRLWFQSNGFLNILDPNKKQVRHIGPDDGAHDGFISGIAFDGNNRAWITSVSGINIIDQDAATVHPFGTTQIISLEEDALGNLWVATNSGVRIVDAKRKTMRTLDQSHGLSNNSVQDFSKIDGKIEVSTNGGFNLIDPQNNTITVARKSEGLPNDTIYGIIKSRDGDLWITGPRGGITRLDMKHKLVVGIDKNSGLTDNNISDVKEDHDGLIWVAPNSNGINIIDPVKNTIKYLNNQPGLRDTCNKVMYIDEYNRIWIGTDKGIYVVDKKEGTIINLTTKQGLTDDIILSLLPYKKSVVAGTNKMISIITPPEPGDSSQQWEISVLDKSEGIRKETSSWNTDAITSKGEFLYGDRGLSMFPNITAAHDAVLTYITGIKVLGDRINFVNHHLHDRTDSLFVGKDQKDLAALGYANPKKIKWDSVVGPYNMPVKLVLPHDKNVLQFHFSQANLGRQSSTLYTYVLEGFDKKWSTPGNNPFSENYLNLSPGKYTFKVSSKGTDGRWKKPAQFSFTIKPPWYQTWLAYLVYILFSLAVLRVYVVYRSRKLTKEKKMLEEKVAHRTQQLSKSLEDLKATQNQLVQSEKMASLGELTAGIAHEIQNPLNFVNNFADVNVELIDELKEEILKGNLEEIKAIASDIKENEQKIIHHGKRAESIVKGMLLHSRGNSGQKEPTDLNALADEYLRLSYHGLRAKDKSFNADFKINTDDTLPPVKVVPQDIGRVVLNLINNAFYAVRTRQASTNPSQDYHPLVTVSTKNNGDHILISVKDNGLGIPEEIKEKIFQPFFTTKPAGEGTGLGLSLSYEIIQKGHNGSITLNSKENEGTEFQIKLPIKP